MTNSLYFFLACSLLLNAIFFLDGVNARRLLARWKHIATVWEKNYRETDKQYHKAMQLAREATTLADELQRRLPD